MACYVMEIDKIMKTIRYLGLCKSERVFSEKWLGQCETYFSSRKALKANLAVSALSTLYSTIKSVKESGRFHNDRFNGTSYKELSHCQELVGEVIRLQLQEQVRSGNLLYVG